MSNIPTRPQPNLDEVIERINAEFRKVESTPFSEHAFEEFQEQVGTYGVELISDPSRELRDIKPKESPPLTYDTQVNTLCLALVIRFIAMRGHLEGCYLEQHCRTYFQ